MILNKACQSFIVILCIFAVGFGSTAAYAQKKKSGAVYKVLHNGTVHVLKPLRHLSRESATCVSCHSKETPGLYQEWGHSRHYRANVGCYECHGVKAGYPGAIRHKDFVISVIVSPKMCSKCHIREVTQFEKSHHAKAGQIIGSLDNSLAEVIEGALTFRNHSPVAVSGCWQCHGSAVKLLPSGRLDPTTWPNTGIGRINPDGSRGACTACHQRHKFSIAQARRPETCGNCHLGPDHPQKEIYDESKHGINFYANIKNMNLGSEKWIAGEDYTAAPTCATCHMSATRNQPVTHDVGDRISWTLRPPISEKIDAKAKSKGIKVKSWIQRRKDMKDVCTACHASEIIGNFYEQYDHLVELYNNKFARPCTKIMKSLAKEGLLTKTPFDANIKWIWFRIWHHSGRRARQGASMQAPDYVQWHGMFEVAQHFYTEFVPEVRNLIAKAKREGKAKQAARVEAVLNKVLNSKEHSWFIGKTPLKLKKLRAKQRKHFEQRYLTESK